MLTVRSDSRQNLSSHRGRGERAISKPRLRARGCFVGLVGDERVFVAYSDESGVGSLKKEPITVVTAVMMNIDTQWDGVSSDLSLSLTATPKRLLDRGALKGKKFYQGVRKNDPDAVATLSRVLTIPPTRSLVIFYGAVDRAQFRNYLGMLKMTDLERKRTDYDAAFKACLERVNNAAKLFSPKQRVLWIAHQADSQREPAMKTEHVWHKFYEAIQIGEGLDPLKVISKEPSAIVDTIYFGSDRDSIALQLADVCCSTITLKLLERFYNWRPCVEPYYEKIRLNVMNDGTPPSWMSTT